MPRSLSMDRQLVIAFR